MRGPGGRGRDEDEHDLGLLHHLLQLDLELA